MEESFSEERVAHARLFFLALLLLITCIAWTMLIARNPHTPVLKVSFLDVGQGDAIFIESPTGIQLLIDGGPDRSVLRALTRELGFFDRSIDVVLLTHEDRDHVGGLPDVFMRYNIASFIRNENQGESAEALRIDGDAEREGATIIYARRGMTFDLGGGALLEILFPDRDPRGLETNTSSIIARLVYGETEFLLTGDAPAAIESYLLSIGPEMVASDVLKAGHHGSRTSTSEVFVRAVSPQYAVISAGKDNRYGHPHQEVIDILTDAQIEIVNTAQEGSIRFVSDGVEVMRK